jgi:hypothetical protein
MKRMTLCLLFLFAPMLDASAAESKLVSPPPGRYCIYKDAVFTKGATLASANNDVLVCVECPKLSSFDEQQRELCWIPRKEEKR